MFFEKCVIFDCVDRWAWNEDITISEARGMFMRTRLRGDALARLRIGPGCLQRACALLLPVIIENRTTEGELDA